jgi:hypothetical protein
MVYNILGVEEWKTNFKTHYHQVSPFQQSNQDPQHLPGTRHNISEQLMVLKSKVDELAIRLQAPKLTPKDIKTFHHLNLISYANLDHIHLAFSIST